MGIDGEKTQYQSQVVSLDNVTILYFDRYHKHISRCNHMEEARLRRSTCYAQRRLVPVFWQSQCTGTAEEAHQALFSHLGCFLGVYLRPAWAPALLAWTLGSGLSAAGPWDGYRCGPFKPLRLKSEGMARASRSLVVTQPLLALDKWRYDALQWQQLALSSSPSLVFSSGLETAGILLSKPPVGRILTIHRTTVVCRVSTPHFFTECWWTNCMAAIRTNAAGTGHCGTAQHCKLPCFTKWSLSHGCAGARGCPLGFVSRWRAGETAAPVRPLPDTRVFAKVTKLCWTIGQSFLELPGFLSAGRRGASGTWCATPALRQGLESGVLPQTTVPSSCVLRLGPSCSAEPYVVSEYLVISTLQS